MKHRRGFVSNSSSASFMVAVDEEEMPTVELVVTTKLSSMLWDVKPIKTTKDLIEWFSDEYEYDIKYDEIHPIKIPEMDGRDKERFVGALEAIKEGKSVYCGSAHDEEEGQSEFVWMSKEHFQKAFGNQNVTVIQKTEGY